MRLKSGNRIPYSYRSLIVQKIQYGQSSQSVMDSDLLHKAAAQAKTGWLEKALELLLPQIWNLTIDTPNWEDTASTWATQIDQMFEEKKLFSPSQQKNRRTDIANALRLIDPAHPAIPFVLLPSSVYTAINNEQAYRLNARENKFFTSQQANELVERAIALLASHLPDEIAAGLAVLVGRRISEILVSQFQPKTAFSLIFSEAVKRRGEMELEFEIPTLAAAEQVLQAIYKLKQMWSIEDLKALNLANNHLKRRINAKYSGVPTACRQHFSDLVPGREANTDTQERLYTHLFRAVYAEIATYYYKPEWVPEHRFKAEIQGHFKLTRNGEKIPNYSARQNYDDYLICDRVRGQPGIKLELPGVEILEVFQKEAVLMEWEEKMPTTSAQLEQGTINALIYRTVDQLLFSQNGAEILTGLILVTGRTIDTLLSAIPSPKTQFSLLVDDMEVPTLTGADQVLRAWKKLPQSLSLAQIQPAIEDICHARFKDLAPIQGVEDLRAVYSCIAIHWFCPPTIEDATFLSAIQANPSLKFQTANSTKGSKLGQRNVEVLEQLQNLAVEVEIASRTDTPNETTSHETIPPVKTSPVDTMPTESTPTKSRHRRKTLTVDAELLRTAAANFDIEIRGRGGIGGMSYEAALTELLKRLVQSEIQSSPDAQPITTNHQAELTIALADQARTLAWLTSRVETLEQETRSLRQERDQMLQQLQQGGESTNLEQLQQDNERLKYERDHAVSKLEAFRQLLNGNQSGERTDHIHQAATELPSPSTDQLASLTPSPTQLQPSEPTVSPPRKRLAEDLAIDNIRHAVRAVMQYNDQPDRRFDDKWYISFPAVQTLLREHGLSANQKNVAQVFDEMKAELETHHDQHRIGSRHNRRHPDTAKIARLISLDLS